MERGKTFFVFNNVNLLTLEYQANIDAVNNLKDIFTGCDQYEGDR